MPVIIALASSPALGQKKMKLAQVSHSLSFTPVYVAMDRGFFRNEGIASEFDPKVISIAIDNVKTYFGRQGGMTETMWRNAIKVNLDWRGIKGPSPKEGEWWTNRYITGSR